jgi:aminoglycoside phosphotransferase (APT) family kinase protein
MVFELCQDEQVSGHSRFSLVENGQPLAAGVDLHYRDRQQSVQTATATIADFADLDAVTLQTPASAARQLKVWAHRLNEAGASIDLPAQVQVSDGQQSPRQTNATTGPFFTALNGDACQARPAINGRGQHQRKAR